MTKPHEWKPGDPLSASRLNDTQSEALRSRRDLALGNASAMVNETLGNQSINPQAPMFKLVVATEDFRIPAERTDLAVPDDVPSAMCKMKRLLRESSRYSAEEQEIRFRCWDVIGSGHTEGETFYVMFNRDSKRWEVLATSPGISRIRFQIVEADCENRSALVMILSRGGSVPGEFEIYGEMEENEQGEMVPSKFVYVYDKTGCTLNESNLNLMGRLGYATWMYGRPLHPYDPWHSFEVDFVCEQQTECEAF